MSKVLGFLNKEGKSYKSSDIAAHTGTGKAEVDKNIKKLIKEGKVESPKRRYYKSF